MKSQWLTRVITIDPVGNMNACTKFQGYLTVWNISLKQRRIQPHGAAQ